MFRRSSVRFIKQLGIFSSVFALSFSFLSPVVTVHAATTKVSLVYPQGEVGISNFPLNTVSITSSYENVYGLTDLGEVYVAGNNENGVLGVDPSVTTFSGDALKIPNLDNVKAIYGDKDAAYAIKQDGTVWSWGYIELLGRTASSVSEGISYDYIPAQITGLPFIAKVASVDSGHAFALGTDGTLWSWGFNSYGEAGFQNTCAPQSTLPQSNCSPEHQQYPAKLVQLTDVKDVSTRSNSTAIVTANGSVYILGVVYNVEISSGFFPYYYAPKLLDGISDIKKAEVTNRSIALLSNTGDVYSWGIYGGHSYVSGIEQGATVSPTKVNNIGTAYDLLSTSELTIVRNTAGDVYTWGRSSVSSFDDDPDTGELYLYPVGPADENGPTYLPGLTASYEMETKIYPGLGSFLLLNAEVTSDVVPPTVTGHTSTPGNAAGWHKASTTINWNSIDPAPSSGTPTTPAPTIANQEGEHVYTSGQSCDPAGNCSVGTFTVKLDSVKPTGSFTTGAGIVVRAFNRTISGTAGDTTSGVAQVKLVANGVTLTSAPGGGITLTCATITNCTWSADRNRLPFGYHDYVLTITDVADNIQTTNRGYTVF